MAHTPTNMLPVAAPGPLPELRALCHEYGVLRLEVFGSALTSRFDPETSDVALLVEYPPEHDLGPWAGQHTGLAE